MAGGRLSVPRTLAAAGTGFLCAADASLRAAGVMSSSSTSSPFLGCTSSFFLPPPANWGGRVRTGRVSKVGGRGAQERGFRPHLDLVVLIVVFKVAFVIAVIIVIPVVISVHANPIIIVEHSL